jgi:galactokinase
MPTNAVLTLPPVPALLSHVRSTPLDFTATDPVRLTRAPGRLDVMGGIADYTGSLVCEMTLDRAAAVASQVRSDRDVRVTSFNLLEQGLPGSFRISLDDIAHSDVTKFRTFFNGRDNRWAAYLAGRRDRFAFARAG